MVTSPRDQAAGRLVRMGLVYGSATALATIAHLAVRDAWWLQPANLATFWWSLPALVVVPVAAIRRHGLVAALAVPALVVWITAYAGLFIPGGGPDVGDAPTLRVMTFNTYVQVNNVRHVVAEVGRQDPDVVMLEEVFPFREEELRRALSGAYPFIEVVNSPGVGGVMVMSRHPITETVDIGDPTSVSRSTALVVLDVGGRALQVVPVHLISPCRSCGRSITARLDFEEDVRRLEIAAVLRALRPGIPAVIAGDFNSNERSGPYRQLTRSGFDDPHRAVGSGPGFTWPNDSVVPPFIRIDWVLTRGLDPVSAVVGDGGPSDHRPVIVDLAFRDTPG